MEIERQHVGKVLRSLATSRAEQPASMCEGRVWTGAQLNSRVAALSSGLQKLGLRPGDRVAIAALNSDWYLEWLLAVPCAGGIIATLNYRWSAEEANAAMEQIDPIIFVVDNTCFGWCTDLMERCMSLRIIAFLGQGHGPNKTMMSAESIISLGASPCNFELLWSPDEIALICFTSGTTGTPKGVAISHTALIIQSLAKIDIVGYSSEDVFLHTAPFCHIGGISSVLAMVMAGGSNVILPKFRADAVLLSIKKYLVSAMIVVPTMLSDLVSLCNSDKVLGINKIEQIFPTVRILLNGGGSLTTSLLESVEGIFPKARIFTAYGMTETSSSMSFMLIRDPDLSTSDPCNGMLQMSTSSTVAGGKPRGGVCVGMPAPCVQIRIQNTSKKEVFDEGRLASSDSAPDLSVTFFRSPVQSHETLDRQQPYTEGNVLTRGPHVMEKYWGRPKETAEAFKEDGWLDTGDIGWMDEDGRIWLLGRSKDMIKSGGENVHSSEVEGILLQHPAISGAVVFGIPDARLNEVVVAIVLLKEGWKWTEEDDSKKIKISCTDESVVSSRLLLLHCQQLGLSRYKVPKFIGWHVEPFPLTSTGKVKKNVVSKRFIEHGSEFACGSNISVVKPLPFDVSLRLQSCL